MHINRSVCLCLRLRLIGSSLVRSNTRQHARTGRRNPFSKLVPVLIQKRMRWGAKTMHGRDCLFANTLKQTARGAHVVSVKSTHRIYIGMVYIYTYFFISSISLNDTVELPVVSTWYTWKHVFVLRDSICLKVVDCLPKWEDNMYSWWNIFGHCGVMYFTSIFVCWGQCRQNAALYIKL